MLCAKCKKDNPADASFATLGPRRMWPETAVSSRADLIHEKHKASSRRRAVAALFARKSFKDQTLIRERDDNGSRCERTVNDGCDGAG